MNSTIYKLKVTFLTSVLGTQPNKDVATEYITSKAVDENGNLPAVLCRVTFGDGAVTPRVVRCGLVP
jgi:hypothetical protein